MHVRRSMTATLATLALLLHQAVAQGVADQRQPTGGKKLSHRVPQLPVVAFKLSLFNRWTAGVGQFTQTARFIAPDQTTVLRKGEVKFALQDALHNATTFTMFSQVEFKTAGVYYMEVLVDDVMKVRFPVPVIHTPPPQPPQEQQPPQPPAA